MFGLFKRKKENAEPRQKQFQFFIINSKGEINSIPHNRWYREKDWDPPNLIAWTRPPFNDMVQGGWSVLCEKEKVVGVTQGNRQDLFLIIGDQEDFEIYLEREPDNKHDKNAIKVMGRATVNGETLSGQIGYVPKETARELRNEKELMAYPHSAFLPYQGKSLGLKIRILGR